MSPSTATSVKAAKPLRKHLDGWQLGVLAVVIAWGSAVLMVPRTALPDRVPLPRVAPAAREAIVRRDRDLAARATTRPLELAVRRLGADVREIGRAEAGSGTAPGELVERTRKDASDAVARTPDQVLELRAYQTELFTKAVYAWAASGKDSADLLDLGGAVRDLLPTNGWTATEGKRTRIVIDELALRAFFKRRWDSLAGLSGAAFALDVDETRAVIAFQIERSSSLLDAAANAGQLVEGNPETTSLLDHVRELGELDPTYPFRFAEGVVHFKSANYTAAVDAFSRFLQATPDGPYALRARNYMKAALQGALVAGE